MYGFEYGFESLFLFAVLLIVILVRWWRDLFTEFSTYEAKYSIEGNKKIVTIEPANLRLYIRDFIKGTKVAMLLFIISEVMFFFSFFWAFFHSLGSPAIQIGCIWPPAGLEGTMPNPLLIPLANTLILLTSGVTVTWAHFSLLPQSTFNNHGRLIQTGPAYDAVSNFIFSMFLTLFLAINFIGWQGYEFIFNSVQMSDSIFGSCFYILTGFHGLHVIIGTIFLSVFFVQAVLSSFHISTNCTINVTNLPQFCEPKFFNFVRIKYIPSVGFDCSVWYWHFVDVVWLFLFSFVYLPDYLAGFSADGFSLSTYITKWLS